MGFSVATHFCGGHAVKSKLVFGDKTLDCGMNKMDTSCETDLGTTTIKQKSCCENQYMSLDVEDDFQRTIAQPRIDVNFVFTFVYTYFELLTSNFQQEAAFGDYSPPLRNRNVQVLFQTFLI